MPCSNALEELLYRWGDGLLAALCFDHTRQAPIRWATGAHPWEALTPDVVRHAANDGRLRHRTGKAAHEQASRVKAHGEVFTPAWVCRLMTDLADAPDPDNRMHKRTWQSAVEARRLEVACGEAPFLTARYDAATGAPIPYPERYGLLDRKLRLLPKTLGRNLWQKWALRALAAIYGYEYQGDNLFLARCNLLQTFEEAHLHRWGEPPPTEALPQAAETIAWNLWQMDGLTDAPPDPYADAVDDLFSLNSTTRPPPLCRIRLGNTIKCFRDLKGDKSMKFDFIIGNPPYQEEVEGKNRAMPIYHYFLDAVYQLSDRVEMIHPARFLFNAGVTGKEWNQKMLNDPHLKVVRYESVAAKFFPGVDIEGGIAITYHDKRKRLGPIDTFTPWMELNLIKEKTCCTGFQSLKSIVFSQNAYRLNDLSHTDHPEILERASSGNAYAMTTNIFERNPELFMEERPKEGDYLQILGRIGSTRLCRWIKKVYLSLPNNWNAWKVFVPTANGSKSLGEGEATALIGEPLIGQPTVGATQTFISIGAFGTQAEAEACLKYVKSKFARVMLGILKVTQHNTPEKWAFVPLQDFTSASDIDWSGSVREVDAQLYRKYGLSEEEVRFIEGHVKEMA